MIDEALLVLASNSPRRSQLLALGNWKFTISVTNIDESPKGNESPRDYVIRLAGEKALKAAERSPNGSFIIGSDTAVVDRDRILGKPKDAEDARLMLKQLRGGIHQVYTAVAVQRVSDRAMLTDLCITDVPMRGYSDEEIESYVASGDPMDKAGAYAIQNTVFRPVESMAGCYASVMGLPMCHLVRTLRKLDLPPETDVAASCQSFLRYACPVSQSILQGEPVG